VLDQQVWFGIPHARCTPKFFGCQVSGLQSFQSSPYPRRSRHDGTKGQNLSKLRKLVVNERTLSPGINSMDARVPIKLYNHQESGFTVLTLNFEKKKLSSLVRLNLKEFIFEFES